MAEALRVPVEVAPERFETKMLRWVQVSPSGGQVVFQALGHLYIRDLPDGEPRRLTTQNDHFEFYPAYSRDGQSIVYTTWDDAELGTVRTVAATGGEGRVITSKPGHYVEPAWTPDGETVVFRLDRDSAAAGDFYWVFGTTSGTQPGLVIAPGFLLPLNFDAYTQMTLGMPQAPVFTSLFGFLDANGDAQAAFSLPTGLEPDLIGLTLHHAFVTTANLVDPNFVSNAVPVTTAP